MKNVSQHDITEYIIGYLKHGTERATPKELLTVVHMKFATQAEEERVKAIINGLVKVKIITYDKQFDSLTHPRACADCGEMIKYYPNEYFCTDCMIAIATS